MMVILRFHLLLLFSFLSYWRVLPLLDQADFPPMGWNSFDAFSWTISEEEFLESAYIISKHLKSHGYKYVVVDYLWYRRKVPGAHSDSLGFDVIDEWGRVIPDPERWPSSRNGQGFSQIAKKVHSLGLKFGIHVMRGLSTQAYNKNSAILDTKTGSPYEEAGRRWHAQDIGIKDRVCAWMPHGFMSVNTRLGAGKAFLRSLYEQYAEWGIDFVKHDCVFGDDMDLDEIRYVSEVLTKSSRLIMYSVSPGTGMNPAMATSVSELVNMYRITGDDWDTWEDVAAHFNIARDFASANMIGKQGALGKSWPDLDMLPLGWLTDPGSNQGPHRACNLTLDEQRTQMTLWAMARSPLIFGGDVRNLDKSTYSLITNHVLLHINKFSSNNMEFTRVTSETDQMRMDMSGLRLINCDGPDVNRWSYESFSGNTKMICWKEDLKMQQPFCLSTKISHTNSDIEQDTRDNRRLHIYANYSMNLCLDYAGQMWEYKNGSLVSTYSGLCVTPGSGKDNLEDSDVRSWIASGEGEIYLALFNLSIEKRVVSAKVSEIPDAVLRRKKHGGSCLVREIWSDRDMGSIKDLLSIMVPAHGCALFVLKCY